MPLYAGTPETEQHKKHDKPNRHQAASINCFKFVANLQSIGI